MICHSPPPTHTHTPRPYCYLLISNGEFSPQFSVFPGAPQAPFRSPPLLVEWRSWSGWEEALYSWKFL